MPSLTQGTDRGVAQEIMNAVPLEKSGAYDSYHGASPQDAAVAAQAATDTGVAVRELPRNLYYPQGVTTLNLAGSLTVITPGVEFLLLDFICPQNYSARFFGYRLFNVASGPFGPLPNSDFEYIPRVNGNRVLNYHGIDLLGDGNFRIIPNNSMFNGEINDCQLTLSPGDQLSWYVIVENPILLAPDVVFDVLTWGYLDPETEIDTKSMGG